MCVPIVDTKQKVLDDWGQVDLRSELGEGKADEE